MNSKDWTGLALTLLHLVLLYQPTVRYSTVIISLLFCSNVNLCLVHLYLFQPTISTRQRCDVYSSIAPLLSHDPLLFLFLYVCDATYIFLQIKQISSLTALCKNMRVSLFLSSIPQSLSQISLSLSLRNPCVCT